MTNNWPDKLGFPPEPWKSGVHRLVKDNREQIALWCNGMQHWLFTSLTAWTPKQAVAYRCQYLGELTPGPNWQAGRDQAVAVLKEIGERAKQNQNGDANEAWKSENFGRFAAANEAIRTIQSLPPPDGCSPAPDLSAFEALADYIAMLPEDPEIMGYLENEHIAEMIRAATMGIYWCQSIDKLRAAIARVRGGV